LNRSLLKSSLDRLAFEYGAEYLDSDPVGIVHRYAAPPDIEVAGLIVSTLGYGSAAQIRRSAADALARAGDSPAEFAAGVTAEEALARFRGFRHRWTTGNDIAFLFLAAGEMIRRYGSIGTLVRELDDPSAETVEGTIAGFAEWIRSRCAGFATVTACTLPGRSLVPSPRDGSACKRPAMYFRWMARGPDPLDFGLWKFIAPARLVVPVDRHMARMARLLGLTSRTSADWRMALEITRALRKLDPGDPLRYDFALVRPGILRTCTASSAGECGTCALEDVCKGAACE
jgi:uncharacterized protein (TIGR02757 family)